MPFVQIRESPEVAAVVGCDRDVGLGVGSGMGGCVLLVLIRVNVLGLLCLGTLLSIGLIVRLALLFYGIS